MKEIINKIKFEYVLAILIAAPMYMILIMFQDNVEIVKIIVELIKALMLMIATFFFTKHKPGN